MAVKELITSSDIRDVDIRDTLNANGGKVSNVWAGYYTNQGKPNPFSRYKPVPSNILFYSLDEWLTSGYKGADGQCGLTIPVYNTPSTLKSALVNGSALWTYNYPNGTTEPYRNGDYRGYFPGAVNPIGQLQSTYILRTTTTGYEFDINVEVVVGAENSTYNLTLNDISVNGISLANMYLGVYLVGSNKSYFRTSETPIGGSSISMTIPGDSGTPGEYTAYLFLSSAPQLNNEQEATMVSLNKRGQKIVIKSASELRMLTAYAAFESDNSISYEIYATNRASSSITYTNVYIDIIRAKSEGEPDYDGIFDESVSEIAARLRVSNSLTIAANTEGKLVANGVVEYRRDNSYAYGVRVSTEEPVYRGDVSPMDEASPSEEMLSIDLL